MHPTNLLSLFNRLCSTVKEAAFQKLNNLIWESYTAMQRIQEMIPIYQCKQNQHILKMYKEHVKRSNGTTFQSSSLSTESQYVATIKASKNKMRQGQKSKARMSKGHFAAYIRLFMIFLMLSVACAKTTKSGLNLHIEMSPDEAFLKIDVHFEAKGDPDHNLGFEIDVIPLRESQQLPGMSSNKLYTVKVQYSVSIQLN
jgi:hypothetical protein